MMDVQTDSTLIKSTKVCVVSDTFWGCIFLFPVPLSPLSNNDGAPSLWMIVTAHRAKSTSLLTTSNSQDRFTIMSNEHGAEISKKEFLNPVQVDTEKIFLYRSLSNTPTKSNIKRHNSREEARKMREKTAHIGRKASHASQGIAWSFWWRTASLTLWMVVLEQSDCVIS